ncbi:MAG: AAA domain-containing protein [Cyclobacteriaceae bacterium]
MHQILNSYLKRLTNLTSRNKSLVLMRLISGRFIDINDFDFAHNLPAFSIVQQLISRKSNISLCSIQDSRNEHLNHVSEKLKKLSRSDRFVFEERGAKDLYLGWPFVRGKFNDGTFVNCPLLFFPVVLEQSEKVWRLRSRSDEFCSINRSFLLAYAHFNQVPAPPDLIDHNFEETALESREFRVELYNLLKETGLEINFNRENFTDNLTPFRSFTSKSFDKQHKKGELKLFPEAVLGLFPQAGSFLVPDYEMLLEDATVADLESFFLDRANQNDDQAPPGDYRFINLIKEEQTFTPFKMDAYQENALKAVKQGHSVVVQGPPGTGKSQLICNLIADQIARGKRVLMVCQKRAALDVVYERLESVGLGAFVSLVHDFKNDRKELYQQLDHQIERLDEYIHQNNSLDAIHFERKFLQVSRRIDQITEELEEFRYALFDSKECGVSIKELYLTSSAASPSINLKQYYTHFHFEQLPGFKRKLKSYIKYEVRFSDSTFSWKDRKSFQDYQLEDLQAINDYAKEISLYNTQITHEARLLLNTELSFEDGAGIISHREEIEELISLLKDEIVFDFFRHMVEFKDIEKDHLWFTNIERLVSDCFKNEGPEVSLNTDELGAFQETIQRKIESQKNLFNWLRWLLFSKEKSKVKDVLRANGLQQSRDGFEVLVEKMDSRLNLEHNLTKLRKNKWLKDLPNNYSQVDLQAWFYYQKKALRAKDIYSSLQNFKQYFNLQKLNYFEFKSNLESLIAIFKELPGKKTRWSRYFLPFQIDIFLHHPDQAREALSTLNREFENLCDFDQLKNELTSTEQEVVKLLYDPELPEESTVEELFDNSLRLAWIDHIELKYPILRSVSSMKFDALLKEYQDMIREKLLVSLEILGLKVRENMYRDVSYNRLGNLVTYRDLKHQVSKKRRIWPIRKLVASFTDELFKLAPCWMASPETVSSVIPMESIFDLVIFDEASQCFAEKGIPAMYRGKQLVIAGDSQQLSPNDLYQIRWQELDTDIPELEIDSLLDLAGNYLLEINLQGHYRSHSLDLIDFSNQHFYQGKLRLLPDFTEINQVEPAIKYIKINGIWEQNTNRAEANEVVALVDRILQESPEKSIGVVTFNVKQQGLIQDLLEEHAYNAGFNIPSNLFVKNIENVQGDERDIIIFSIAYAPDQNQKLTMQFGSLNAANGENRLNVAITRAKYRIYLIASITPDQLKVDKTKNLGPKLLKKYLQYAWDVSQGAFRPKPLADPDHSTSWYLKNQLKSLADTNSTEIELKEELPFADLTVKKNNQYLGLILTDDNLYYQSASVKDSHVYIPFTLSKKFWKFKGFFSRQYWMDPQATKVELDKFVHRSDV